VDGSGFDEVPSASLKDDSDDCVLLCNLSEPEVEEASLADCEEPCLVAESSNTFSAADDTQSADVELNSLTSPDSDHCVQQSTAPSTPSARTSNRKKRSVSQSLGIVPRKKQKTQ